jgi:hypothetical protein
MKDALPRSASRRYWTKIFDRTHAGLIDTWDNQWNFTMMSLGGLSIEPKVNLVSNIGFGADATHTLTGNGFESRATEPMRFPLIHPTLVAADARSDDRLQRLKQSFFRRAYYKLIGLLSSA